MYCYFFLYIEDVLTQPIIHTFLKSLGLWEYSGRVSRILVTIKKIRKVKNYQNWYLHYFWPKLIFCQRTIIWIGSTAILPPKAPCHCRPNKPKRAIWIGLIMKPLPRKLFRLLHRPNCLVKKIVHNISETILN